MAGGAQGIEQVVSARRCLRVQNQTEHLTAQIGQAGAFRVANAIGLSQQLFSVG